VGLSGWSWSACLRDRRGWRFYAGCIRCADGGGLTAEERRAPCPMKDSTYRRRKNTVSTWKKSAARIIAAWAARNAALAAIQEAVDVYRDLAARWPDGYQHELEQSLQRVAWLEHGEDFTDPSPQEPRSDNGPLSGLPPSPFVPKASLDEPTSSGGSTCRTG
jgi:hypothetical protein